ncbi:MAG: hypothetical protein WBG41_08365 [Acidimicrobiales bacterium]
MPPWAGGHICYKEEITPAAPTGSAGGVIRAIWLAMFVPSNCMEFSGEEERQPP